MGVQGLTTFVDENPHLLTDLHFRDTRVVIDGNNLYFFLYKLYGVSYAYTGDYDVYARAVSSYFKTLKSVGIQPYVVFDGCYDSDDRKLNTVLKRAREKIETSNLMSKGMNGNLIPLLASMVFREVLVKEGIPHVTCDEEADGEIAALANDWGCPVMSNDSDFYIYDLEHGFILFDYLNLQVKSTEDKNGTPYKYLHAQIYYLKNLFGTYNRLDRDSVALFATLMGNDFIDQKHFQEFFRKANVSLGRRQVSMRRHYKMTQLLNWMNHHKGDILKKVLDCISKENREKVKGLIDFSVRNYTKVNEISSAVLTSSGDVEFKTAWKSFHGNPFPDWLVAIGREGKVYTHFLNILVLQKVIVPCQIELSKWPSAMLCGQSIRQIVYSILLSLDRDSESNLSVTEYIREERHLVKKVIQTLAVTTNGVAIPNLGDLPLMDVSKKEEFFFQCLGLRPRDLGEAPHQAKLLTVLLVFFINNASPKVNKLLIYSIIISFIKLVFIDNECVEDGKDLNAADLCKAKESLKKYNKPVSHTHAHPFNGEVVYSLAQFQSCWLAISQLHQLLMLPERLPSPTSTLNGTFIYHLYTQICIRTDPLNFIQDLLGAKSTLKVYFDQMMKEILNNIPADAFIEQHVARAKKSRKRGKRKHEHGNTQLKNDSDSEKASEVEANCDLANRFSQLLKDT